MSYASLPMKRGLTGKLGKMTLKKWMHEEVDI